jgi:REP element-mobilizing transposase RayT
MRSRNKIYNPEGVFFITSTVIDWIEIFNSKDNCQILIDAINFSINNKKLEVYSYVIMKNHFHMICKGDNLSRIIGSIKGFAANKILEKLKEENSTNLLEKFRDKKKRFKTDRNFQVWQEGFYPKEILNDLELKQKIEYIHYNPVKENYCENMVDWPYSSARYYEMNVEGLIKIKRII